MDNMHAHHDPCVPRGKLLDVLVHGHLCFFQDRFALHFQLHGLELAQLLLAFQTCRHQNVCACVIFPSVVDVLLCKSEGAEDATCQTELLINGFPARATSERPAPLEVLPAALFGLGFALPPACMQCMDMCMKTFQTTIGLHGHCSAVGWALAGPRLAADSAVGHEPGPWDPAHARC